jgi:hypothetical protein
VRHWCDVAAVTVSGVAHQAIATTAGERHVLGSQRQQRARGIPHLP